VNNSDIRLEKIISRWQEWAGEPPEMLEPMPQGLTNESFLMAAAGKKYVLRLNSAFDADYNIDREIERQAHRSAETARLTVPLVLSEPAKGFHITEYCAGKSLAKKSFVEMDWLSGLGEMLFEIHQLPKTGAPLDYAAHCQHYLNCAAPPRRWGSKLQQFVNDLAPLFEHLSGRAQSLCHHDLSPENVLSDCGRLLAIDWEYARVGSPAIDVAIVLDAHKLTTEQSHELMDVYRKAGGNLTDFDVQRAAVVPAIFDVLWQLLYERLNNIGADNQKTEEKLARVEQLLQS